MSAEVDFYELLQVSRDADDGTLKSSYRKLAMKFHPDRNPGCDESEAKFKAIGEAYECLKDPQKRAAYDRFGHEAYKNGGGGQAGGGFGGGGFGGGEGFSDIGDIFESIFGNAFGGGGGRQQARRGADLRYALEIGLEEAFHGKTVEIEIDVAQACEPCGGNGAQPGTGKRRCTMCGGHGKVRAQQGFFTVERTCPTCSGMGQIVKNPCKSCGGHGRTEKERSLSVNIPAGGETGTRIRLAGEGEAGMRGGPTGDLYIFIEVKEHALFQRDGVHLFCRVPISIATAALGGEVEVPTIDGGKSRVKVPAGSQTGKQMRLRAKGMPALRGGGSGDMLIELAVETPVNLTARQKELLREFEGLAEDNNPEGDSFFSKLKGFWDGMKG